jgi:hypothetical protein
LVGSVFFVVVVVVVDVPGEVVWYVVKGGKADFGTL